MRFNRILAANLGGRRRVLIPGNYRTPCKYCKYSKQRSKKSLCKPSLDSA